MKPLEPPASPCEAPGLAADVDRALTLAVIPEHSAVFMRVMSGGACFLQDDFLFLFGRDEALSGRADWLMAIGYRLGLKPGNDRHAHERDFCSALHKALAATGAERYFAMAPSLPASMRREALFLEEDVYYTLAADTPVPARLRNVLASVPLEVVTGKEFTPGHRRLWAEFMGRTALKPNVRELYARTGTVLETAAGQPGADLRLLDAVDGEGRVVASLLLDFAPCSFVSYIIGAHSRSCYVPHATDRLFQAMLEMARAEGKTHIQLGLGVNEGITRFKRKWGGTPSLPYLMGQWKRPEGAEGSAGPKMFSFSPGVSPEGAAGGHPGLHTRGFDAGGGKEPSSGSGTGAKQRAHQRGGAARGAGRAPADELLLAMLKPGGVSRWQFMLQQPEQRPLAMLWKLEKNGKTSWIAGSAHFCRCSFRHSLEKLFSRVDTVIFEGPLDAESLLEADGYGETAPPSGERVLDFLEPEDVERLRRRLCALEWRDFGDRTHLLPEEKLHWFLAETRPWYAFFSLWTAFLERRGWESSVDLEAWALAHSMQKVVFGMESIPEQMAALESAPMDRIVRFLRDCDHWDAYRRHNEAAYLWGDLEGMMGTSTEFPSRTETIIDTRDQRFRERMRPWLERGDVAVFVGSAHMLNLRWMLREDGFAVHRVLPTWKHRLRAGWRKPDADLWPAPGVENRPCMRAFPPSPAPDMPEDASKGAPQKDEPS